MPREIYLVKVGMNMTEGVVEEWYVPDGGTVTKGELLYRLETEKVNLDVDAESSGTVRHVVGEGITMEPGDVVGYIFDAGEAIPDDLTARTPAIAATVSRTDQSEPAVRSVNDAPADAIGGRVRVSPVARRLAAERGLALTVLTGTGPMGRIVEADVLAAEPAISVAEPGMVEPASERAGRSSPMARKVARELGIELDAVQGSGPGGRITRADVEAAAEAPAVLTELDRENRHLPLRGMRKTIARRMHESLQTMAQLTMDMDVVMDEAIKLRTQLIAEWEHDAIRPTYTDLVIRAVAKALLDHPTMNASLTESELVLHGPINVGMAVALEDGLIVPVVRHADRLEVKSLARETSKLAAAARDGRLTPDDLQGGTFTVTALGMFGVDSFTPIVNSPQAGILGVNRIREEVAWDSDKPVRQQRMRLSLTWDHRVLDGAPAAHFLSRVKELLESPFRLLV